MQEKSRVDERFLIAILNRMAKKPKKARGRPPKDEKDKRGNVLRILLTATERAALDDAAKVKTLEVSTWARMMLLEAAQTANPAINRAGG